MRLNCLLKSRPGRLARLFVAEKRQRSRARERDELPPPKLSAAQRMARRRIRELFLELTDEIIDLIHEEVGR